MLELLHELTREAEVWVLVGFVIFVAVVWKPIRKILNAQISGHIQKVQTILDEAEALRRDAAEILESAKNQRRNIQAECQAILANTEKESAAIIAKTEIECERIIAVHRAAASDKITQSAAQARAELRLRAGELVLAATRDVLHKQMEGRLASALIDQSIAKIPGKLS
ncbi:MAG: hypothetical protein ORN98_06320 [Alphaproteobacteria bacterium]|nr:hypothetical protein [Alphaproteobacteria bacterium]